MEPASFTAAGRTWLFDLNLLQVRRIQTATGGFLLPRVVDLASEEHRRLASDSDLLCRVLEIALQEQLKQAGVSLDQLLEQMSGDEVAQAVSALMGATANFSRSRTTAATVRLIQQGLQELSRLDQIAGQMLQGLAPSGAWFGSPPESPVSSPGSTHSGNSLTTPMPLPGGNQSLPVAEELPPVPVEESVSTP